MPPRDTRAEIVVSPGERPKRLDYFLANRDPDFSRAALRRLILDGRVTVDGRAARPSRKIKPGNTIVLVAPRAEPLEIAPEPIPLDVLYEDDALLVLNKQAGLVAHPAPGHWSGTLVNALLSHVRADELSGVGGRERPGLVHRLDKNTTGVMVVAKQDGVHADLARQFKRHTITRLYQAVIRGVPRRREGLIEVAIGRDTRDRKKFSARTTRPKPSSTRYRITERFAAPAAFAELSPQTGRTHQLRVHLAAMGHPILGDPVYGGKQAGALGGVTIPRVMLHAAVLGFLHPLTHRPVEFAAPMPDDMTDVIRRLRAHGRGTPAGTAESKPETGAGPRR